MPSFPLHRRIVEVVADRGERRAPRYLHGSGFLVAGRTVLTAAHVIAAAQSVLIRDTDKVEYRAVIDPGFIPHADGNSPDLALVEIADRRMNVPEMPVAAVNRNSPAGSLISECHAFGYPEFMEHEDADGRLIRETAQAVGYIPVLSGMVGGLLSLEVNSSPAPLPTAGKPLEGSPWSGMSGGPVVAQGCLLGVVTEHAPRAGPSAITVTPLTALNVDPAHPLWGAGVPDPGAWWARLGVTDIGKLRRLPPPRQVPPYLATVRVLRDRTGVLKGRQDELAQIAAFATGDDGYRWLIGQAYAGKTSLLAHAIMSAPEDADVICYFPSRREADADSIGFLAAVVPQLSYLLNENAPPADRHEFRVLWRRAVERAGAEDRHLLLVVDGLDEDLRPIGQPSVASLLPEQAGGHVHVLVSSRPHPPVPLDVAIRHPLRDARQVQLQPFAGAQQEQKLAMQEIDNLLRGNDEFGNDVLGLLTAAAGPLAAADLADIMTAPPDLPARVQRRIQRLLDEKAARSLQEAALAGSGRYQFAHESLLQYARSRSDLNHPDDRSRIHQWAEKWQTNGWPVTAAGKITTPQYLLDTYPATLADDSGRLGRLAGDIGWVEAAIISVGVDHVLANLRRAVAASPASTEIHTMLRTVTSQAHNLRDRQLLDKPGYVLRQMWMQAAAQLTDGDLADQIRNRLLAGPGRFLLPLMTTSSAGRALSAELDRHEGLVETAAVLPDGRIVAGGGVAGPAEEYGQVLIWDPGAPGVPLIELGRHEGLVETAAVLPDGRIVTGGKDGRVLVWNPAAPGTRPIELGRHTGLRAVAVLPDGRVITGGSDKWLRTWEPDAPRIGPTGLHHYENEVYAMAVLPDGRVVTGGRDGRVLAWNPGTPRTSPVELGRHRGVAGGVAVLPGGRVVSGGWDGRVLVGYLDAPGSGPVELGRHKDKVDEVAVLPDGRVVTGGRDGRVLVWNPGTPKTSPVELVPHEDRMDAAIAVLPDSRVVTIGRSGRALIWDPHAPGTSPAVLPDGRVATTGRLNDRMQVWNPNAHSTSRLFEHGNEVPAAAVTVLPDGRVVTVGLDGRNMRLLVWDPDAPGTSPVRLAPRTSPVKSGRHRISLDAVAVLPDGRIVTLGRDETDGQVLVWDPDAPRTCAVELGHHHSWMSAVAVLPDGRIATVGAWNGWLRVWDPDAPGVGPVEVGRLRASAYAMAVLPDGRVVTVDSDVMSGGWLLVWDPGAPGVGPIELGRLRDAWTCAMAVLPDGRVVTGGRDGRVLVWDADAPRSPPIELGRRKEPAKLVGLLPDGRVVSGGRGLFNGQVLIWDPDAPGSPPTELGRSREAPDTVAILSDGRIATSGGGRVLVWNPRLTTTEPEIQVNCRVRFVATSQRGSPRLVLTHLDGGFSAWSLTDDGSAGADG